MRKHYVTLVLVLVISLLAILSCSAPTPAPAPAPAPAPTPAPAPAPTPTPAPAPSPAKERMTITLWGQRPGSDMYGNSYAMATVVNRWSEWLTLEIMTTESAAAHALGLMNRPEERPRVIATNTQVTLWQADTGVAPFTGTYRDWRVVAAFGENANALATYNPAIKTMDDLAGKRVMLYPAAFSTAIQVKQLVDAGKLPSSIHFSHGVADNIIDALRDGTIDAGLVDVGGVIGGPYDQGEALVRLNAEKPGAHFIGFTAEHLQTLATMGQYTPMSLIPPKSFGPTQTEPVYGVPTVFTWIVDKVMSDKVTYEVARILHQHTDYYLEVYPAGSVAKEAWAQFPAPESQFHPGALKYYKEAGLPLGTK